MAIVASKHIFYVFHFSTYPEPATILSGLAQAVCLKVRPNCKLHLDNSLRVLRKEDFSRKIYIFLAVLKCI